jgi:threonine dehydrogenase-like Zn-dependent dehydrogenase
MPGVYGGLLDKVPIGAAFAKGLTLKMGQTHVHKYLRPLLARIEQGEVDPALSSRITCAWRRRHMAMKSSGTKRTAVSRLCSGCNGTARSI